MTKYHTDQISINILSHIAVFFSQFVNENHTNCNIVTQRIIHTSFSLRRTFRCVMKCQSSMRWPSRSEVFPVHLSHPQKNKTYCLYVFFFLLFYMFLFSVSYMSNFLLMNIQCDFAKFLHNSPIQTVTEVLKSVALKSAMKPGAHSSYSSSGSPPVRFTLELMMNI